MDDHAALRVAADCCACVPKSAPRVSGGGLEARAECSPILVPGHFCLAILIRSAMTLPPGPPPEALDATKSRQCLGGLLVALMPPTNTCGVVDACNMLSLAAITRGPTLGTSCVAQKSGPGSAYPGLQHRNLASSRHLDTRWYLRDL